MDYKRAYEELREVYLQDRQVADELVKMNEKLKQNLLAEEEEHNETMKKHDELVELIKQVHHEIKGITRCRVGFIGEYQVYCCQLERYRIDRLEAALCKAVGKD
jgi:hypothetical protein